MLREAGPADAAALDQFLAQHAATSMFLRGNLATHGTTERGHPHGTTFWITEGAAGIEAVVGCTNKGYLMCQAPGQKAPFWTEATAQLAGRPIAGITGAPDQTGAWIAALGLAHSHFRLNDLTPLFQVALADLKGADERLSLRKPQPQDQGFLPGWFGGFFEDTGLGLPVGMTTKSAAQEFIARESTRILVAEGRPVAMTALNAQALDMVQVGGVYVPPQLRGRGYGGSVVALHLAELARAGITQAILFAANEPAAKAYRRIGFRQVGEYRVAMLVTPVVVGQDVVS